MITSPCFKILSDSTYPGFRFSPSGLLAKTLAEGGVAYPPTGEIDLMKYYNGALHTHYYARVKASEKDVKSLLWLTRVKFESYVQEQF